MHDGGGDAGDARPLWPATSPVLNISFAHLPTQGHRELVRIQKTFLWTRVQSTTLGVLISSQ